MKMIWAGIRSDRIELVARRLKNIGISGCTVYPVHGYGDEWNLYEPLIHGGYHKLEVIGHALNKAKGGRFMQFLKIVLWVVFLGTSLTGVFADQEPAGHGHKTPHGGVVQEAEGMHAELVIDSKGEPRVYLYDKSMKPLERSDLQGRVTVKEHNGRQHERDLKFAKDPKEGSLFKGEPIQGVKDWDTAVVSLKAKDKWTHIRFSHHAGGKGAH